MHSRYFINGKNPLALISVALMLISSAIRIVYYTSRPMTPQIFCNDTMRKFLHYLKIKRQNNIDTKTKKYYNKDDNKPRQAAVQEV